VVVENEKPTGEVISVGVDKQATTRACRATTMVCATLVRVKIDEAGSDEVLTTSIGIAATLLDNENTVLERETNKLT
jgi:hypothetical protein